MTTIVDITRSTSCESIDSVDFLDEGLIRESIAVENEPDFLTSEFKKRELRGEMQPEPLLLEDKQRFVLFPIKHTDVRFAAFG